MVITTVTCILICITGDGVIVQCKKKGRNNEIEEPNDIILILSIVTNYDDRSFRSYYCYKQ